jgi:hypothetical protein
MQESRPSSSGSGEARGNSSEPADATSSEEPTQGDAEFEIPLGVPVDEAELRRLKEEARNLEPPAETEDASAQDESEDEPDREESGPAEDG